MIKKARARARVPYNAIANSITESKMDLRIHITHEHVELDACMWGTHKHTLQTFNNFKIYFKIEICVVV